MLMPPLPSLSKVFSIVIKQEQQFNSAFDNATLGVLVDAIHSGTSGRTPTQRSGGKKVCTHCGKIGHTIDTCYKKHRFPPRFKFQNPSDSSQRVNMVANDSSAEEVQLVQEVTQEPHFWIHYRPISKFACSLAKFEQR